MAEIELIMPKMGESVAEATITKWLKSEGDSVEAEEPIIEIATDKVDSEIPAPESGVIKKILFQEDEVVQVGQAIAIIEVQGAGNSSPSPVKKAEEVLENTNNNTTISPAPVVQTTNVKSVVSNKFFSPLVKSIAEKEGISIEELESINGSGNNARVTKDDLVNYLSNRKNTPNPVAETKVSQASNTEKTHKPAVISLDNGDEIIQMDRMRKMISDHMTMSKHTSAHVTSFVEADVTNMVLWRNKVKDSFQKREGEKITFTPIIMEAVAKAIKEMPMINVSVDGDKIIKRKHINLGMATALPSGNLIVPVIKDADQKNLVGLSKAVNDLANRARINKLSPDEVAGGTFTVTNVGTFGNVMGTPIINQPQVAIMAVGAIRKKPAVIETPFGDTIGIRHQMFLSLSYDHRVVDGSLGGSFVQRVAKILEEFDINRDI
ncbi:MAG: 2-oxo acid dehydrogenase subunit E2 [Bacteroidetes bacterium]|nr:MAG: 2-oxo acid dehydrogenase subunit E2 [Bacteroidota bacterium]MBL1145847.1 2-oxo acid dehydrogenase subunit E2 [Bacteroidota bacterium]NOG58641.1 2-oxo acid dehydrogenase subunit E2 [Bacteroidota bacterium]